MNCGLWRRLFKLVRAVTGWNVQKLFTEQNTLFKPEDVLLGSGL